MLRSYTGWQKERSGFLFGLDGLQAGLLLVVAVMLLVPLVTHAWLAYVVTVPVGAALTAGALVPVGGQVGARWFMIALAHQRGRLVGGNSWRPRPLYRVVDAKGELVEGEDGGTDRMELPGMLAPVRMLVGEDSRGGVFCVLYHRTDRTYTAVARCSSEGLAVLAPGTIDRRVGGWGSVLAQQCQSNGLVSRVGVYQRVEMADGDELRSWNEAHIDPAAPVEARENLRKVFVSGRGMSADTVAYLTVTIDAKRGKREIRAAGGGHAGAASLLLRQMSKLTGAVRMAGVSIDKWLDNDEMAAVIRTAFAPEERRERANAAIRARQRNEPDPGVPPSMAGPTSARTRWGVYEHDEAYSVTAEVEWPKTPRDGSVLVGLLAPSSLGRRHLALLYEPVSPLAAERTLTMDRTKRDATLQMRRKTGQIPPERERQELDQAIRQDKEVAAGHGLLRFVAYVTVTVTDPELLDGAWDELAADAGAHGMTLRRCAGWQDAAFVACTVPAGIGLTGKGLR